LNLILLRSGWNIPSSKRKQAIFLIVCPLQEI